MNEQFTNNRMILAGIAIVVVLVALGGGYYFWSGKSAHSGSGTEVASLSDGDVCEAVAARARDYGVIPFNAKSSDTKTQDANNPKRVICGAQTADAKFKLVADVDCDDAKDAKCLKLQTVTQDNGTVMFNREI